jgi:hypothetical protein
MDKAAEAIEEANALVIATLIWLMPSSSAQALLVQSIMRTSVTFSFRIRNLQRPKE